LNEKKKFLVLTILAALAVIAVAACGTEQTNAPAAGETAATTANTSVSSVMGASQEIVSESAAAALSASSASSTAAFSFSEGKTAERTKAITTAKPATAKASTATQRATAATTTTQRVTTTTRRTTTTAAQTQPPKSVYTEADYAEIIAAVRNYAESKTSIKFIWDTTLTRELADQGRAGYHDMPNLTRTNKEAVLADLKYNVDLTEINLTGGNGGVPSSEVHYNIYWFVDQQGSWGFGNNDVCLILVYR
jgi:hypothetical protein